MLFIKFFMKKDLSITGLKYEDLSKNLIKEEDLLITDFDCILGKQFTVENFKFSKILKNHLN